MKKWQIIAVGIVLLIPIIAAIAFEDSLKIEDTSQTLTERIYTPEELLAEANKLRAEKGVAPLTIDTRLNESAQWKAQDMADYDYFGHVRDGYNGAYKAYDLTRNADGISDCKADQGAGENIEKQGIIYTTSPFEWWVTSEPHYKAILDPKYDTTGFGIVKDNNTVLYVQHFCDLR